MTGLIATLVSLVIQVFFLVFAESSIANNIIVVNFAYHIYSGVFIVYLLCTFMVWKRLILYQKSKNLIKLWEIFEYALYGSLLFDFFSYKFSSNNFNSALLLISLFSIVLSINLKWIAYLNTKQKWKSILFMLLSGVYLYHFVFNLNDFSSKGGLAMDLMDRVFIVSLLIFIFLYASVAVLVTLFNLPTSSVFERKIREAIDFQKLSQVIPKGQSARETFEILLDSSMSAVSADAGRLEYRDTNHPIEIQRGINNEDFKILSKRIKNEFIKKIIGFEHCHTQLPNTKTISSIDKNLFKSAMGFPIIVQKKQVGYLLLINEVRDAFNKEMTEIIRSFVSQASVAIENALLIKKAIENERYKEQLNIAKNVQKRLLPSSIPSNDFFEIVTYSTSADEIGGDYYDLIEYAPRRYSLIIGDVSGKGTSAAYNMAQMKGVFNSLVQLSLSPKALIYEANLALGKCLEKSSFITASYFDIETVTGNIKYVRAGHCPTFRYDISNKSGEYLVSKGMGLGIIRNQTYKKFIHQNSLTLKSGDILLLHTDGITEASNKMGDQYGEDRLQQSFLKHVNKNVKQIQQAIIDDLYNFLDGKDINDDYTLIILKYN